MADTTAGTIYDLGYKRYEGVRLGRRHAIWALYVHSLRGVFGIGRSLSSKVGPIGLAVIAFIPAAFQLGIAAIAPGEIEVIRPEDYFQLIEVVLAVFCAVVAPELVGRDQRTQTLSLYFSRALRRQDYALAKFAALMTGMLAITVIPQVIMFVGNGLAAADFGDYLRDEWADLPSILGSAILLSGLIAGIGLVIAAQMPSRAYSTVGIIAAFVLTSIIAGSVFEAADQDIGRFVLLLSPFHVARGLTFWFFDATFDPGTQLAEADLPGVTYAMAATSVVLLMLVLLLRRYEKISP
ncbi:MAG: ABC transporter permease subunit [Chloroflexi bacterium]|nr:ABC transporter permease subunit [Chloroflexota bacterium]